MEYIYALDLISTCATCFSRYIDTKAHLGMNTVCKRLIVYEFNLHDCMYIGYHNKKKLPYIYRLIITCCNNISINRISWLHWWDFCRTGKIWHHTEHADLVNCYWPRHREQLVVDTLLLYSEILKNNFKTKKKKKNHTNSRFLISCKHLIPPFCIKLWEFKGIYRN